MHCTWLFKMYLGYSSMHTNIAKYLINSFEVAISFLTKTTESWTYVSTSKIIMNITYHGCSEGKAFPVVQNVSALQ